MLFTGKSGPIDVVFAVDGSTKIDPLRFTQMKNFVSDIVSYLPVSETEVHVGVVEYSDKPYVEIYLDYYFDSTNLREAIELIKPSEGETASTEQVIKIVRERMFVPERGSRSGVPKVLVIVTDGRPYVGDKPEIEAGLLRQTGVRVLVVPIGDRSDTGVLGKVVSRPENLYPVNQGSNLRRLVPPVAKDILKTTKGKISLCYD